MRRQDANKIRTTPDVEEYRWKQLQQQYMGCMIAGGIGSIGITVSVGHAECLFTAHAGFQPDRIEQREDEDLAPVTGIRRIQMRGMGDRVEDRVKFGVVTGHFDTGAPLYFRGKAAPHPRGL